MIPFQDPHLPAGVTNADVENEPTFICTCDTCGEELYKGDVVCKFNNMIVCDDTECIIPIIETREHALSYCSDNINDFIEHIDFKTHLWGSWKVTLDEILHDFLGNNLTVEFCKEDGSDFVDWLEKEGEIIREVLLT